MSKPISALVVEGGLIVAVLWVGLLANGVQTDRNDQFDRD